MNTHDNRLLIIFYEGVPTTEAVRLALLDHTGVSFAALAIMDEHSEKAGMWTRDPLGCLPRGRLAIDADPDSIESLVTSRFAENLGGVAYLCEGITPLAPQLNVGERFSGTLQLCCFQRRADINSAQLKQYWLLEHTDVALSTQNTLGYRQNRVSSSGEPHFDGIVEEYFPPEAGHSMQDFFADGDNEARMWEHIEKLTKSSERFLDLDRSEVIHLSDTRII
jgi:hypothetical protein